MSKIINQENSLEQKELIKQKLAESGVICFPTETVYGIGCLADNDMAVSRIYKIKNRSPNKSLSVLVDSKEKIKQLCIIDEISNILIDKFTPGPLTLVLKLKDSNLVAPGVANNDSTIGVRIPNYPYLRELIAHCDKAIIGTSCNLSGEPSATMPSEISEEIIDQVDYVIEGQKSQLSVASTVVRVIDKEIQILRVGTITEQDIAGTMNQVGLKNYKITLMS